MKPVYSETFMVPFKLMGLAIGRDGANIKRSKKIKRVRFVIIKKKPDGYRFRVIGEVKNWICISITFYVWVGLIGVHVCLVIWFI